MKLLHLRLNKWTFSFWTPWIKPFSHHLDLRFPVTQQFYSMVFFPSEMCSAFNSIHSHLNCIMPSSWLESFSETTPCSLASVCLQCDPLNSTQIYAPPSPPKKKKWIPLPALQLICFRNLPLVYHVPTRCLHWSMSFVVCLLKYFYVMGRIQLIVCMSLVVACRDSVLL